MRISQAAIALISGITIDADIDMDSHKLTGLSAPASTNDSLRYGVAEIRNAEIKANAAIAGTKLALTGHITNAMVKSNAAIAYSKLNLALSILNADVNASAAIALSKLASLPLTMTIAETEVFTGNSPGASAWTDLDLSGTIGANSALVILKIRGHAALLRVAFRKDGDTDEFYSVEADAWHILNVETEDVVYRVVIVPTSAAGVIEWKAEGESRECTIDLIAYIK